MKGFQDLKYPIIYGVAAILDGEPSREDALNALMVDYPLRVRGLRRRRRPSARSVALHGSAKFMSTRGEWAGHGTTHTRHRSSSVLTS